MYEVPHNGRMRGNMIIIIVVILGFIGLCLYGIFMPKFMVKQGRLVDARVVSCEQKSIQLGEDTGSFYEITVDFYGLHGETIQRKFQSEEPYAQGDIIRSRYIDKTGRFMQEADKDVKNNSGLWVVIGFLIFVLALILSIFVLQDEEGELPDWFAMGFGYFISILFMLVGVGGIKNSVHLKKNSHRMQVIPGYLVDYVVNDGGIDDPDTYQPIYEYELMGIPYRYQSRVAGSGKKYRTIGRKVHMLRDCETGKVVCKEDEKTSGKIHLIFGFVGLIVFLVLLAGNAGLFQNTGATGSTSGVSNGTSADREEGTGLNESSIDSNQDESKLMVYVMYPVGEEKFSYSIEITESGEGSMILFPSVTVSGKGVDQYIDFKLSISDIVKIGGWIEEADVENLYLENVDIEGLTITVYVTEGNEQYDGRGTLDMHPYGDLYELLSEIVPADVWEAVSYTHLTLPTMAVV